LERTPTAKPPSGPKTTAEKTSGRSETDALVCSVMAMLCRSAIAATAPRKRIAQIGDSR
jgi:hypothetical protein